MTILSSNSASILSAPNVTRIFHPVGQGGFYTETIDNKMVVYDCGGTNTPSMENYLQSFLHKDSVPTIEKVFISHLHYDHINGLEYLRKICPPQKVYLPLLTPSKIIETLLYNAIHFSSEERNTANKILSAIISGDIPNVQVLEDGDALKNDNDDSKINSGEKRVFAKVDDKSQIEWVHIPYNPRSIKPKFKEHNEEHNKIKEIYNKVSMKDLCREMANYINEVSVEKLKQTYKELFGNNIHNSQSMALFSGVLSHDIKIYARTNMLYGSSNGFKRISGVIEYDASKEKQILCNFLYLGDYEAKGTDGEALIDFYQQENHNVWDTICGIQVPHHGSRHNYRSELYQNTCYAIVSAGSHNRFHHPNVDTIIQIFQQGCIPHIVTEDINTQIYQQFKFLSL